MEIKCFKAYDLRGQLGTELNTEIAYRVGRAFAAFLKPKEVVVGGDIRLTSKELKEALTEGLLDQGVDVIDLGMTGTEEIYFATDFLRAEGGIEVTASHNPIDYNGMKFVKKGSRPISGDTGLQDIKKLAEANDFPKADQRGQYIQKSVMKDYIGHLMTYINPENIKPLKLVINSGNGAAGHVIDALESQFKASKIPVDIIKLHHEPDGTFPNGIPNPLLPENRDSTSKAVLKHKADMGIAFDGDFDRCFLFDEKGQFIEGYYIVGLLAEAFLQKHPGSKIIHDPRLSWNTKDIVENAKGTPVVSKSGHAFIKEVMREQDAIYGGEMSAHHYFRDFAYCDSGMIPWLLVMEMLCIKDQSLSQLVEERIALYPSSGEINSKINDTDAVIATILTRYKDKAIVFDETDGISLEFEDWRFNLRLSNTEPVIRLNVESRNDHALMKEKTAALLKIIRA